METLTIKQAAHRLNVGISRVHRLREDGQLTGTLQSNPVGPDYWSFPREEVEALAEVRRKRHLGELPLTGGARPRLPREDEEKADDQRRAGCPE